MTAMSRLSAWVTAAVVTAAVTAALGGVSVSLWMNAEDGTSLVGPALSAAVAVAFTAAGAVIVFARPANRVGWLTMAGGVMWAVGSAGADAAYRGVVIAPHSVPAVAVWAIAGSAIRGAGWFTVVIGVPMVFPDGHIPATRWHWLPAMVAAAIGSAILGVLLAADANLNLPRFRNPIAPPGHWQQLAGLISLLSLAFGAVAAGGAIAQLRRRLRQGGALERQQLSLFASAVALPIVVGPIVLLTGAGGWLFSAAALPLPVALGFAVLARGLYDLKTAANRGLVWLTLSALVVGVYALVIAGVGTLLHASGASWLPWIAAAVVAVSFAPMRDALQRGINRVTFGRWDEPYDVLATLGQRLEATADVDRLLADVVTELEDGLGLRDVAIADWRDRLLAGHMSQGAEPVAITLTAYGRAVGWLQYRAPDGQLRARDSRLLDDMAGHLGGLLHARQLTDDLRRARERLVLGREEERRRLRRDLHDGLGAALAGHVLRLEAIAGEACRGAEVAAGLEALREEMTDTVTGIRRLVEGLRPPALDQLGLAGAVTQASQRLAAGTGLTIEVAIAELPELSAGIEVAAFRIATEAVTNVIRHARASACSVSIASAGDMLRVAVRDDGIGARQHGGGPGHGLDSMRERAEELSGSLRLDLADGTTVIAELPLAPATRTVLPRAMAAAPA
jgi:signal transduction histidine kinase